MKFPGGRGNVVVKRHAGAVPGQRTLEVVVQESTSRTTFKPHRWKATAPIGKRARLSRPDARALDAVIERLNSAPAFNP